jgi:release factor glutamine methyltransferase
MAVPDQGLTVGALVSDGAARLAAAGSESPRLDAELLLGQVLGVDRTGVVAAGAAPVGQGQAAAFEAAIARRVANEPIAYIRGFREFHGLALATDPRALIPRPETELLVDAAVAEVVQRLTAAPRAPGSPPIRIADVGTGSGAIALALLAALRKRRMDAQVTVLATDASPEALDLARENAVGHGLADRLEFAEADLLPDWISGLDIVCANLPYVRTSDLATLAPDLAWEPRAALDGGADGLDVIRRLLLLLPSVCARGGVALLEIGADQGTSIADAVADALPGWRCTVTADLAGLPRLARVVYGPHAGSGPHAERGAHAGSGA